MDDPLRRFMRLGLVHWMAYPETALGDGPIVETVTKIARDECFEVVEVSWIHDADARDAVARIAKTARLDVYYGGMPRQKATGVNINDLDEDGRQAAVRNLQQGIDEAHALGAKGFAFMSGKYAKDKREEHLQALIASTSELCEYAMDKGRMAVNLEIFDHDVDHCCLLGPVDLVERYAAEMRSRYDNFGLMVDLSHLPQLRETSEESLLPVRNYIRHAHVGNAYVADPKDPAYGDKHPRFGYPGAANDVDEIAEYLRILLAIGYLNPVNRPVVSIEVRPVGDEDSSLIIANAKRTLQLAWDKV